MKKFLKNESGFTLVELMVVVAIIGILAAVAIPNYKKYQAKSRASEGKIQLSAAFAAQQSYHGEYGGYHTCLNFMGFDQSADLAQMYYTIGFGAGIAVVDTGAAGCNATAALDVNVEIFRGTKGLGGIAQGVYTAAAMLANSAVPAGTRQTFQIAAMGGISQDQAAAAAFNNDGSENSIMTMNENKVINNIQAGY